MAKTKTTRSRRAGKRARKRQPARTARGARRQPKASRTARSKAKVRPRAAAAKRASKASAPKKVARRGTTKAPAAARRTSKPAVATPKPPKRATPRPRRAPTLDRERRRISEPEVVPSPPSSLDMNRPSASAARSGRADLAEKLHKHTSTGPALTAGDLDADWEAAESIGDEAPGGDNPTPDQDVVDDIGKALGVEYDDDEELQGGDEILERDRNRWELDPASSDDYDERDE